MAIEDELSDDNATEEEFPEISEWMAAFLLKHFTEGIQHKMTDAEAAQYALAKLKEYSDSVISKRRALDKFVEGIKGASVDE